MTLADAEARDQALDLSRHVLVAAPAGSGKTGLLVQRLLAALATVDEPEQVVAITFTNKAAAEIRGRVMQLLRRAACAVTPALEHEQRNLDLAIAVLTRDRQRGWNLIAQPDRLRTSTIDGFNSRIAADLPLLSGLGGRPQVALDTRALHEHAVLALFDRALESNAPTDLQSAAGAWLRSAGNRLDRLLPPLAALLDRRDQWAAHALGDPPDDDRVLSALHRAQQQRLLHVLGAADATHLAGIARTASGDHESLAWAAHLAAWPVIGDAKADTHIRLARLLVTDRGSLRKPGGINVKIGFPPKTLAKDLLQGFLATREGDDALAAAADAVQHLPPTRFPAALSTMRDELRILLHHALAQLKLTMATRGEVDFAELAMAALQALRPDTDQYGDALLKRDRQVRHLLVDEMQDTSQIQLDLIGRLTEGWQPGDGHSLFLVGDPQQSIYAFRNARVALFMNLWATHRLGALELTAIQLRVNFRSTPALLDWFNAAFTACFPRQDDPYSGAVAFTPAESPVVAPTAAPDGAVVAHAFSSNGDEAEAVADRVAELSAAGNAGIAILARARAHLPLILAALRARGLRYACQDIDALVALPAMRDLLACAHALWHPQDRLHWAVWLRAAWVGFSWADMVALSTGLRDKPWPQRLHEVAPDTLSSEGRQRRRRLLDALDAIENDYSRITLAERVESLWLTLGGPACGDATALADARRTLQLLREHTGAGGFRDLAAFERAVAELYASPAEGRVQVMTIHKAKGLEFDHLLLVGCGRRIKNEDKPLLHLVETPHGNLLVPKPPEHWPDAQDDGATALFDYTHALHVANRHSEALRLLYVATTRARRTLDLYAAIAPNKKDEFKPPKHGFAEALWRYFEPAFARLGPSAANVGGMSAEPPRAPRLPVDFVVPQDTGLFVPRALRTLRPSERVLSARESKREGEDGELYAQAVGTLFHQAMARIADAGITVWNSGAERRPRALASGLRRLGVADAQVEAGIARVTSLVDRCLASEHGRWLLADHPWDAAEYALSGYRNGEWVAAAIDRCFEDDDGKLWIIDYKTTARPLPANAAEGYMAACRQRYTRQLQLYAELMALDRPGRPIRTALYLVEFDRLVSVDPAARSAGHKPAE